MAEKKEVKIILVHGGGHGSWCWYKVVAILRSEGYSVTAIDLAASGSDPRRMPEDVSSLDEYSQPLMDFMASVAEGEKVVLVGHSYGGFIISKAMDAFPEKILVSVFVTAMLPDTVHPPWYIFQQLFEQLPDKYSAMKTKSVAVAGSSEPFIIVTFTPEHLRNNLYQNCSFEDFTLANIMVRPASCFQKDLSDKPAFSNEGYGSADKVFIVCGEDAVLTADFQHWMIKNCDSVKEVMEIKEADHMGMLSKPKELCQFLTTIFGNYANNIAL